MKWFSENSLRKLISVIQGDLSQWAGSIVPTFREVYENLEALDSGKVDKINGKGLSTEDYTTTEKTNLASHLANSDIHVTSSDKTRWDGKANVTIHDGIIDFTGGSSST